MQGAVGELYWIGILIILLVGAVGVIEVLLEWLERRW